jgi:hypothetical protein
MSWFDEVAGTGMMANLAAAYPREAGVTRWMRTATLDRKARRVRLEESFELKQEKIVSLVFMTPKQPAIGAGSIRLGKTVLAYDPSQLTATPERIELTDATLHHAWGDALYRVLLTTPAPVERGAWKIELHSF